MQREKLYKIQNKMNATSYHVFVHKENGFAKALKKYNFYFQRKEHYVFYLITNVHNLNTWSILYTCEYFVVQNVVNPIVLNIIMLQVNPN